MRFPSTVAAVIDFDFDRLVCLGVKRAIRFREWPHRGGLAKERDPVLSSPPVKVKLHEEDVIVLL